MKHEKRGGTQHSSDFRIRTKKKGFQTIHQNRGGNGDSARAEKDLNWKAAPYIRKNELRE